MKQAFGNAHAHKFRAGYVGTQTRAFYDCWGKFGVLEREASIVANLPVQYGKNAPKLDTSTVLKKTTKKISPSRKLSKK